MLQIPFEALEKIVVDDTVVAPYEFTQKDKQVLRLKAFFNSKSGSLRGRVGTEVKTIRFDDVLLVLFHANTTEPYRHWELARATDLPEAYDEFAQKNPGAVEVKEATERANLLRRWRQADSIQLTNVFLKLPGIKDRQKVVQMQAQKGKKDAVKPLLDAARDDAAWPVRIEAVRSLGEIGDPEAVPVLTEILAKPAHPTFSVRKTPGEVGLELPDSIARRLAAAEALGRIGSPLAIPELRARVESDLKKEPNLPVKIECMKSLGKIGGAPSVEACVAVCKTFDPSTVTPKDYPWTFEVTKRKFQALRDAAIAALEAMPKIAIPDATKWGEGADEALKKALEKFKP